MTTNLDDAGRDIAEMLLLLETKMKAKGWEKARAEFVMRKCYRPRVSVELEVDSITSNTQAFPEMYCLARPWKNCHGLTVTEAFAAADKAIAEMLDHPTEALAPWFAVEPEKVAAE